MASRSMVSSSLSIPLAASSSTSNSYGRHWCSFSAGGRRLPRIVTSASPEDSGVDTDDGAPAFNPFGFVTDNPSSRSAIQLPESPAEDGNVGQMLYRTEDKGKDYGRYVKSGELIWFVRETGRKPADTPRGTIVFLHGAPTQSYSYRVVMSKMTDSGFRCIAPDWIGFGFSDKPQPGYGFDYTEKEFHEALSQLLEELGVQSPFYLVTQGFLVGSYGLTWALKNQERISKLVIMNSPLTVSSPVPGLFQQLRIPLFGEFTCQNAVMAERFIEAGSAYVLKLEKADVYRLPYLSSSGPGFALLEAARKINFRDTSSQIAAGFESGRNGGVRAPPSHKVDPPMSSDRLSPLTDVTCWDKPILVAWGISDKYLPQSIAEEFKKSNPGAVELKLIEGAGHMPQEDWPEKVVEALRFFL